MWTTLQIQARSHLRRTKLCAALTLVATFIKALYLHLEGGAMKLQSFQVLGFHVIDLVTLFDTYPVHTSFFVAGVASTHGLGMATVVYAVRLLRASRRDPGIDSLRGLRAVILAGLCVFLPPLVLVGAYAMSPMYMYLCP